ncbi:Tn3 family transposase [Micromonospora purpureochromogenes]|uniref:Tn3 family transposase n=1 Tax=Micromonospora purpureochromogenes TaxID=47872 RepID=UPI0022B25D41|nr:Tn3 family transposase [Micromonospora purpureochromogenes]
MHRQMANCAIYSTALDITDAANTLAAEGHPVDHDDLATITPYITHTIRRLGDLVLDPPDAVPTTRLDLEPRGLFPRGPAA